jgi:6-phosphogluconolactonase
MRPPLLIDSVATLGEALTRRAERLANTAIARRGRFALAVPGGSVATTMLPRLAAATIDWSRTEVFFVDERAVPPADRESNYAVARAILVQRGPAAADRLHRMPADLADLEAAARMHGDELQRMLGEPPRLDLVLLGMGPDGHVASLFPGRAALGIHDRWVAAVHDSPKPPARRLTMTLPVLTAADLVVVAAFGPEKATAIHDGLENPESDLPVRRVLGGAHDTLVLLDPDAGALFHP